MAQAKGKAAAGRLAVRGKRSCKSYALRMQRDRVAESWDILDELSQVGACGVGEVVLPRVYVGGVDKGGEDVLCFGECAFIPCACNVNGGLLVGTRVIAASLNLRVEAGEQLGSYSSQFSFDVVFERLLFTQIAEHRYGAGPSRERIATDAVGEVAAAYVYLVMEWAKDVSACVCVASEECVAFTAAVAEDSTPALDRTDTVGVEAREAFGAV